MCAADTGEDDTTMAEVAGPRPTPTIRLWGTANGTADTPELIQKTKPTADVPESQEVSRVQASKGMRGTSYN